MNYSQIAGSLTQSLSLRQPPVAISFADSVPSGISHYAGKVPAGCRFWEEAAGASFATSADDHNLCAIGIYTHNFQPSEKQQTDLIDALGVFKQLGYVREEDLPLIPVLKDRPQYAVYAPLAEAVLPPDIVLLFVDAAQTLILSEATSQVENQNAPAMGRPACAVVPQVMNSGRAALSLGCCGARAYLDNLNDGTALFAIPGAKLEAYASHIESLSQANSVLTKFHQLRRRDVEAGQHPTIKESLAAFGA
jgi:uncharacterized protein (DUF169 family)